MQSPKRVHVFLALLSLAALACGDSTSPESTVGVYALESINGSAPPVIIDQDASGTLEVTGGQVSLNADHTFSDRTDFRFTASNGAISTAQDITTGTYSQTGNTITLSPTGDTPYSMVLNGNTLTQIEPDFTIVYRR